MIMLRKCVARPRPHLATPTSPAYVVCVMLLYGTVASAVRHSRHLDVKSQFLSEGELSLYENHRPSFPNCSNYAPVLKEEEPRGTVVIQVHAEDRDPPEKGGTITYSLMTHPYEKSKFEINNKTGLIRTTYIFERDEPAYEKEAYLMVLATDNGRFQLDDVCTFKVTIEDVNDNDPVFDKVAYTESVPQNLPVGHEVMRVSATDMDNGNNSVVRYSLSPKRPDDAVYFRIDRESGIIFLNKAIDRDVGYKFNMTATAEDLGEIPQTNVIDLDIRVVESHKKIPAFLPRLMEPIKLQENFSDFDTSLVRLKVVSNDNNSDVLFELMSGRTEQTNKRNTFRLESNKDVADIKLSQLLDYENNKQYSLTVRVLNTYQLAAETVVNIEVLDVNDNIPVFRNIKTGSVLENEPRGVHVMQVQAIDNDGTSVNNQVTYELDNFRNLFAIDSKTGNITTLVTFDREVKNIYTVIIIATDNSPSALFKTGEHNKGQQTFQIEIVDRNDNPPRFTQKVYIHNLIYENANINAPLTEVKAIDFDSMSLVTYSIISGNTDDSFYIEATTGKIRVKKPLDYEKITKYNLTVRAFDGVFNDTAQVEIFIENINPPVFEDFNKTLMIEEEKLVDGTDDVPRCRKLADLCGEDSSDKESDDEQES